jgi:hypothetical protein
MQNKQTQFDCLSSFAVLVRSSLLKSAPVQPSLDSFLSNPPFPTPWLKNVLPLAFALVPLPGVWCHNRILINTYAVALPISITARH